MNMNRTFGIAVVALLVFLGLLAVATFLGASVPFNPALDAWTKWVASIVGIIVSARVFWAAASWVRVKAGLTP